MSTELEFRKKGYHPGMEGTLHPANGDPLKHNQSKQFNLVDAEAFECRLSVNTSWI